MNYKSALYSLMLASIFVFFSNCTCEETYKNQYDACFSTYSGELESCQGNEACANEAMDVFQSCLGREYVFPVHFTVLTNQLQGSNDTIIAEMQAIVDTLNRYFTAEDNSLPPDNRKRIITFSYKSTTLYNDAVNIGGDMVDHAVPDFIFEDRHDFRSKVNNESNQALKSDDAINVFIVDMKKRDSLGVITDVTSSHGKNNDYRPYIVLDYARINGDANRVGAEEHEMGHGFRLAHVCTPGTNSSSSTNIMATPGSYPVNNNFEYESSDSTADCSGSSGRRDIGFNPTQTQIIIESSEEIKQALGL